MVLQSATTLCLMFLVSSHRRKTLGILHLPVFKKLKIKFSSSNPVPLPGITAPVNVTLVANSSLELNCTLSDLRHDTPTRVIWYRDSELHMTQTQHTKKWHYIERELNIR